MQIRRNTVVYNKTEDIRVFGRVNRVFPNGLAEVVDCGAFRRVLPLDVLVPTAYKGRYIQDKRFSRMPSLRKLKQMVQRYDKTVWKSHRGKESIDDC